MRQRRFYTLGFLLVLLAAGAGAWLARNLVGPVQTPRLDVVATIGAAAANVDVNSLIPRRSPAQSSTPQPVGEAGASPEGTPPRPDASLTAPPAESVAPATGTPPPPQASPTPPPTATVERPTPTSAPSTPTPTSTPEPPADAGFAFVPLGAVRHGSDDCPGPSIRGVVRDAANNPLAGVRLWRYDQWGNQQTVESKSAAIDLGQYDFPLGDTPNVHYVQVVDRGGAPISPVVEVQHRQGTAPEAACHWIDWRGR